MHNRVRANAVYTFDPVPLDAIDPPHGVKAGILAPGDSVRVVALRGCPPPNTMGMAHVQTMSGEFAGLVCCNSLTRKESK